MSLSGEFALEEAMVR